MPISRPAYSQPFLPGALQPSNAVYPMDTVTPEWAWGGSTGHGVRVAVIDSGIDATHPAVGGPVHGYVSISEHENELVFDTDPHDDSYGHGTACAGLIRALAPDCEIYSIKVLGAQLTGRGVIFAAGLRWAIEHGMHVCNLSLSTSKRDFFSVFHELADQAYFKSVMLVSAANNMPAPSYPSLYASVFSVAAHDVPDPYCFYYNSRPPVEFGAFGINVPIAWRDGSSIVATGNSFAAPQITGIITRILAKHPSLTAFQMKALLRALAANVTAPAATSNPASAGPLDPGESMPT